MKFIFLVLFLAGCATAPVENKGTYLDFQGGTFIEKAL